MKKIFKILAVSLFIMFIISVVGLFVFIKTFNVSRFKPQILTAAQKAIGRSVDFGNIALSLSFKNGVQFLLEDLKVGEHPDFGRDSFLTAKEVSLGVSIKDLIFKRQIRVLNVQAQSPEITIVRLKDERINVQTLAPVQEEKIQPRTQVPKAPRGKSTTMAIPAFFINRVSLSGARVKYIDYLFEPAISLEFKDIKLNVADISLTRPFALTASAAFLSKVPNITLEGKGKIDMNRLSFSLKDAKASVDLSSLSVDTLRLSLPQLQNLPTFEINSGRLISSIRLFEIGQQGLIALEGEGLLVNGLLRIKELAVPIDSIEAKFTMSGSTITLNNMSFSLGKGKVAFSGDVEDYLNGQNYTVKAKAEAVNLAEVLEQSAYPIKVKGLVFGDFEVKGQGFDPKVFLSKLSGKGTFEIREGRLTDMNILKMVLEKVYIVPNLAQTLEASLPERFKEKLRKKDTIVTALKLNVEISNGTIVIEPMNVEADGFVFRGNGKVGFDQSYEFEGIFIIPQDLTSSMIKVVPQMDLLLDQAKQINFPLRVSGKGTSVSFKPDVKSIGVTVIKSKAQQELEKVLKKVFDKNKEENVQDGSQEPSPDIQPAEADSSGVTEEDKKGSEKVIRGIIDTIFKQ